MAEPPPTRVPPPSSERGYVICSSPRSGSTYLAYLLKSTGVLGNPLEWIRGDGGPADAGLVPYPSDATAQIKLVLKLGAGSTKNGVYGLKMFPEHFDARTESRWARRLPNLTYVNLIRQDLLGQAISLSIARQTGSYHSEQGELAPAKYDRNNIRKCLAFIAVSEARWKIFFAVNGITPLTISYEDILINPSNVVSAIANRLCMPLTEERLCFEGPRVQRSERNAEWRERFITDVGDLCALPSLENDLYLSTVDDLRDPDPAAVARLTMQPGRNLLHDPGFISDFYYWSYFGNGLNPNEWKIKRTSQDAKLVLETESGSGVYSGWTNAWTDINPGEELGISADLSILGGIDGNIHCDLQWRDAQGALTQSPTIDAVASGGFRRVARRVVAPKTATSFRFRLYASQLRLENGGQVALRRPKVEVGQGPTIYSDDSTPALLMERLAKLKELIIKA